MSRTIRCKKGTKAGWKADYWYKPTLTAMDIAMMYSGHDLEYVYSYLIRKAGVKTLGQYFEYEKRCAAKYHTDTWHGRHSAGGQCTMRKLHKNHRQQTRMFGIICTKTNAQDYEDLVFVNNTKLDRWMLD